MIRVEKLTKRYGATLAVDNASFEVAKGEVVGFLGPNGAGKTTTMRIITGSLGATDGEVSLDGKDVAAHPRETKARIGYLPEVPPLYGDMTVRNYVRFAARLKGVEDIKDATEKVIAKVGLTKVAHRIVDHLSKGYRQRVGLAQALVHDPEVLILDEPYSGLDPAQRVEIRELLEQLVNENRTIILSTHVLADIEALAQKVVIINSGKIVGQGPIQELLAGMMDRRRVVVQVEKPGDEALAALSAVESVIEVDPDPGGVYNLITSDECRAAVASAAVPFGLLALSGEGRLEDVYLHLTRKQK